MWSIGAGGGGGRWLEPTQRRGGGSGKGALVTGQSQEASLKPLMITHHLRRGGAPGYLFSTQTFPHDPDLKMISALWGITVSHMCWATSGPPTSPVSPSGVPIRPSGRPVTGAQQGGAASGKGLKRPPPPPAQANSPPTHGDFVFGCCIMFGFTASCVVAGQNLDTGSLQQSWAGPKVGQRPSGHRIPKNANECHNAK